MPFERFTNRVRKVMALADREAERLNHEYLGTEHILLGLVLEGSGVGATVLKNLGLDLDKVRREVEGLVKRGPDPAPGPGRPHTPLTKKAMDSAIKQAHSLKHNYVGTEHILLGLISVPECVAAKVLTGLGLDLDKVRRETLELLEGKSADLDIRPCAGDESPEEAGGASTAMFSTKVGGEDFEKAREVLGPGHVDSMLRQAIQMCWWSLPKDKRNLDEVERQIRRLVDRALKDLREDHEAFGR